MYSDALARLAADNPRSAYLFANWWSPELETHIEPVETLPDDMQQNKVFPLRFPPRSLDDAPAWSPQFIFRFGSNGFDHAARLAHFAIFESDWDHGTNAQSSEQLAANDAALFGKAEIHTSTHDKGRHHRVRFATPVPCNSLSEYNALCRYTAERLGMTDKTCAKGGFLWIFETTATGFRLISEQTELFAVPENWEPPAVTVKVGSKVVELNDNHHGLLDYLVNQGYTVRPHTLEDGGECYSTHTAGLKRAHPALDCLGVFETVSQGRNPQTPNCYIIPTDDGGWRVYRHGTAKEPGWNVRQSDGRSWCWFNQFDETEWDANCAAYQGHKRHKRHTFTFAGFAAAAAAAKAAGVALPTLSDRQVTLALVEGNIQVEVPAVKGETAPEGWLSHKKTYSLTLPLPRRTAERDTETTYEVNNVKVGYHFSEVGRQKGQTLCYVQHGDGVWKPETKENVGMMLFAMGMPDSASRFWLGQQIANPLKISCRPFAKENDDPTFWERGFKFACDPVKGEHPTYTKVVTHTFEYLDPYVKANKWCKDNGIATGYDFGIAFCAIMVQDPGRRVPQLFLNSREQATGKDTFQQGLGLLMEDGAVVSANDAALSDGGFSGELEGRVVYVINELDLSKAGSKAEGRCREWVSNPILNVHPKGLTPYSVRNYGRLIQLSNDLSFKAIDLEDARVIVIVLSPIPAADQLDWQTVLQPALIQERAAFLHTLLNYELPKDGAPGSRFFLPVLTTDAKIEAITASLPQLTEDQSHWFRQIVDKATQWKGLKDFAAIKTLIDDVPASPITWGSAWNKMTPHLKAMGLEPTHRPYVEKKHTAAWGFAA